MQKCNIPLIKKERGQKYIGAKVPKKGGMKSLRIHLKKYRLENDTIHKEKECKRT